MAYVTVPRDLNAVKKKVFLNLTKRQILCFGAGGALGIALFFLTRPFLGTGNALFVLMAAVMPFVLLGMYEKNGMPLEKFLKYYCNVAFRRPKVRPYRTRNYYACLQRQIRLEQEVNQIVRSATGTKAGGSRHPQSKGRKPEKGPVRPGQHSL